MLVVNDHFGKAHWPGLVTGKVSDLAGSFFLTVLAVSGVELIVSLRRKGWLMPRLAVTVLSAALAMTLILTKTLGTGARTYGAIIGLARWPVTGSYHRLLVVVDPTDLVALVTIGLAWAYCTRRSPDATRWAPSLLRRALKYR